MPKYVILDNSYEPVAYEFEADSDTEATEKARKIVQEEYRGRVWIVQVCRVIEELKPDSLPGGDG